jgi:starvation-inducible DNA-binding protein
MLLVRTTVRHPRTLRHDAHRDAAIAPDRRQVVLVMNDVLAQTLNLSLQARRLRWHATGPSFAASREMLRQMATDLDNYSDLTAQRAVLLGGIVDAHFDGRQGDHASSPQGVAEHRPFMTAALGLLTLAVSSAAALTRHEMHTLAALGDPVSEHLLEEVASGLDKWTWCLEVHLQGLAD